LLDRLLTRDISLQGSDVGHEILEVPFVAQ
jgi:hypothetical protein